MLMPSPKSTSQHRLQYKLESRIVVAGMEKQDGFLRAFLPEHTVLVQNELPTNSLEVASKRISFFLGMPFRILSCQNFLLGSL